MENKLQIKTLWSFLLDLLLCGQHEDLLHWVDDEGEFLLERPDDVARLWGQYKGNGRMNYEKLSRSLRYYYDKRIITKVDGKRYAYKFVALPETGGTDYGTLPFKEFLTHLSRLQSRADGELILSVSGVCESRCACARSGASGALVHSSPTLCPQHCTDSASPDNRLLLNLGKKHQYLDSTAQNPSSALNLLQAGCRAISPASDAPKLAINGLEGNSRLENIVTYASSKRKEDATRETSMPKSPLFRPFDSPSTTGDYRHTVPSTSATSQATNGLRLPGLAHTIKVHAQRSCESNTIGASNTAWTDRGTLDLRPGENSVVTPVVGGSNHGNAVCNFGLKKLYELKWNAHGPSENDAVLFDVADKPIDLSRNGVNKDVLSILRKTDDSILVENAQVTTGALPAEKRVLEKAAPKTTVHLCLPTVEDHTETNEVGISQKNNSEVTSPAAAEVTPSQVTAPASSCPTEPLLKRRCLEKYRHLPPLQTDPLPPGTSSNVPLCPRSKLRVSETRENLVPENPGGLTQYLHIADSHSSSSSSSHTKESTTARIGREKSSAQTLPAATLSNTSAMSATTTTADISRSTLSSDAGAPFKTDHLPSLPTLLPNTPTAQFLSPFARSPFINMLSPMASPLLAALALSGLASPRRVAFDNLTSAALSPSLALHAAVGAPLSSTVPGASADSPRFSSLITPLVSPFLPSAHKLATGEDSVFKF